MTDGANGWLQLCKSAPNSKKWLSLMCSQKAFSKRLQPWTCSNNSILRFNLSKTYPSLACDSLPAQHTRLLKKCTWTLRKGNLKKCGSLQLAWLKSEIVKATADVEHIEGNQQLFSAHETTQEHLVIVFSNGVRHILYHTVPNHCKVLKIKRLFYCQNWGQSDGGVHLI